MQPPFPSPHPQSGSPIYGTGCGSGAKGRKHMDSGASADLPSACSRQDHACRLVRHFHGHPGATRTRSAARKRCGTASAVAAEQATHPHHIPIRGTHLISPAPAAGRGRFGLDCTLTVNKRPDNEILALSWSVPRKDSARQEALRIEPAVDVRSTHVPGDAGLCEATED
jgi:hypothetical protein